MESPETEATWREKLTPEQYRILRQKGTEMPFTGKYVNEHADGTYRCVACGNELFSSQAKFDSGSGWPSFADVIDAGNVELHTDFSHFMRRTEVSCANCGGHLGHVFDDGPAPTGKRFCINSQCLILDENMAS